MSYKVLGQVSPSANTDTTLYTVPSSKQAVSSSIVICNQNGTSVTYRIAIRVGGASIGASAYLAYDVQLPPNTTDTLTLGITLDTTDVVTVRASATGVSFNLFGSEA